MYLYGQPDQPLGFRLISLVIVDWDTVAPILYRMVDGVPPREVADADIVNCGGGQFVAILSAGDSSGDFVSYQMEADNCVPDEKTIAFFRGDPFASGLTVAGVPSGPTVPDVNALYAVNGYGIEVATGGVGEAFLRGVEAGISQMGMVSVGGQSFGGHKRFRGELTINSFGGDTLLRMGTLGGEEYLQGMNGVNYAFQLGIIGARIARMDMILANSYSFLFAGTDAAGVPFNTNLAVQGADLAAHAGVWGTSGGGDVLSGGLVTSIGSGPSSVAWGVITGTPNTLAGYGIPSPLPPAVGGSGADLSGSGPGPVVQASSGAAFTVPSVLPPEIGGSGSDLSVTGPGVLMQTAGGVAVSVLPPFADGDVLTGSAGVWVSSPAAGGSLSIGDAVLGGTGSELLCEDAGGMLANTDGFTWTPATGGVLSGRSLTATSSPYVATIGDGVAAARFSNAPNTVDVCGAVWALDVFGQMTVGGGGIAIEGVMGETLTFRNIDTPPSTAPGTATDRCGGDVFYLGDPAVWLAVQGPLGMAYKIPAYS